MLMLDSLIIQSVQKHLYMLCWLCEYNRKTLHLDNKFSSFRDHALSLNPKNFKIMVDQIREAEKILGEKKKK